MSTCSKVNGKLRCALNGVSHVDPETPLHLAEYYQVEDKVFKYDVIKDEPSSTVDTDDIKLETNVVTQPFRNFVEIIFENRERSVHSWHLSGHSFFAVG